MKTSKNRGTYYSPFTLYITKNPPLQGTPKRSALSDRLLVAYVPLPAEGPPCPNPGLKSIK